MLTWLASTIWSFLSWLARGLAARGWLARTRLPVRVVSVGNLQAGGAGKTPLVAAIANEAHERGLRACILCRGYGGEWERSGGVILPRAGGARAPSALECGDEAALLHDLAPHAVIGVGARRGFQFRRAAEAAGRIDLVVLDDGFQHWRLRKDVEIVALTSKTARETLFRDWPSALRGAHLVVWTKGERRPDSRGRPECRVRFSLPAPASGAGDYWLVTGVADGGNVRKAVEEAGYRVVRHIPFPDHARYAEPVVRELLEQAARSGARLALTGKDWVKWRDLGVSDASRVTVLEPALEWLEGRQAWDRVLWGG